MIKLGRHAVTISITLMTMVTVIILGVKYNISEEEYNHAMNIWTAWFVSWFTILFFGLIVAVIILVKKLKQKRQVL